MYTENIISIVRAKLWRKKIKLKCIRHPPGIFLSVHKHYFYNGYSTDIEFLSLSVAAEKPKKKQEKK